MHLGTETTLPRTEDAVSGLPGRDAFLATVESLRTAQEVDSVGAVVQVGLDNFRHLNASYGLRAGDDLLRASGRCLGETCGERPSVLARVGDDVFAMFLPEADARQAAELARNALDSIACVEVAGMEQRLRPTASAGVAETEPGAAPEDLLLHADIAMAKAKADGRNRVVVYAGGQRSSLSEEHSWAREIREAIASDAFLLYRQPVQDLDTRSISQWELLTRLELTEGTLMPPASFLPIALRFGLIERLDEWVVGRAAGLLADHEEGSDTTLDVNIAANSLADPGFVALVAEHLERTGAEPSGLVFEVSEVAAVNNPSVVRATATRLRELGCRIALDNFGAGYGSLQHLKQLPLDFVKFDETFIRHLRSNPADQHIVRAVAELSDDLGQRSIAAYVGDEETLGLLGELGVDYAQGFHVGLPEPVVAA